MKKNLAFTLIEMLVVIGIIGILASVTALSYTQVTKSSRDARRKTDLEQLRGALEQYKSDSNFYPKDYSALSSVLTGTPKYIESIPTDPKGGAAYGYLTSPANCDNVSTYCTSYELSTPLENPVSTYTITPYGVKVNPTSKPPSGDGPGS